MDIDSYSKIKDTSCCAGTFSPFCIAQPPTRPRLARRQLTVRRRRCSLRFRGIRLALFTFLPSFISLYQRWSSRRFGLGFIAILCSRRRRSWRWSRWLFGPWRISRRGSQWRIGSFWSRTWKRRIFGSSRTRCLNQWVTCFWWGHSWSRFQVVEGLVLWFWVWWGCVVLNSDR